MIALLGILGGFLGGAVISGVMIGLTERLGTFPCESRKQIREEAIQFAREYWWLPGVWFTAIIARGLILRRMDRQFPRAKTL